MSFTHNLHTYLPTYLRVTIIRINEFTKPTNDKRSVTRATKRPQVEVLGLLHGTLYLRRCGGKVSHPLTPCHSNLSGFQSRSQQLIYSGTGSSLCGVSAWVPSEGVQKDRTRVYSGRPLVWWKGLIVGSGGESVDRDKVNEEPSIVADRRRQNERQTTKPYIRESLVSVTDKGSTTMDGGFFHGPCPNHESFIGS